jgi:apolipoprotein N-acyltransferase
MKSWKVPAVILPCVCFGGYFALVSINWGGDTLDILSALWAVLIVGTVIWLLLALPWRKIKITLMNCGLIRNWKVSGIILVLLILAMAFRWSTISSQTTSTAVLKHVQDNWNGAVYEQQYPTKGGYNETIVKDSTLITTSSQGLTYIWGFVLVGSILWLLIAVSKTKKVDDNKEYLKT